MRFEQDEIEFLGGVRHGRTLGSPVAILVRNSEWATGRWAEEMDSAPGRTEKPLTQPRPGHADLAGMQKYGFTDARDVLERASARETAARVAAGALAKVLLSHLDIAVLSHVIQLGAAQASIGAAAAARRSRARRHVRGPLLRHRRRARDDPRDQGSGQGRRLARRRGRGARLRRATRARLARPLGPPHRRVARAGVDEHPGDEGGRDRRGLRRRGPAGQRCARRDRVGRERRDVPARVGAGGWDRRRHDHRRSARRARRDEAARDA